MPISSVTAITSELNVLDGLTSSTAELNILDTVTAVAAELNYLDITTLGTGAASKAMVPDGSSDYTYPSGGTFTAAGTNVLSGTNTLSGLSTLTGNGNTAGAGITSGSGTLIGYGVQRVGTMFKTTIIIDLTGLNSAAQDDDIIGVPAGGDAYICRITAALNGTIFMGRIRCIEVPTTGDPNIALWSATESTGAHDSVITDLTETEIIQSQSDGTDWELDDDFQITTYPAANQYLYLVQGDGTGTDNTYNAGKFIIEFWGV